MIYTVVASAAAWFFCVLSSYYTLRPMREMVGSDLGTDIVDNLFLVVFITVLVANPLYSALVARVSRRVLVHFVYRFFVVCLIGLWWFVHDQGEITGLAAQFLFVFVSVFNLFVVTIFWSFLADAFTSAQAKRWYGVIAAGGTFGAVAASFFNQTLAQRFGIVGLLVVAAILLEVATYSMEVLHRGLKRIPDDNEQPASDTTSQQDKTSTTDEEDQAVKGTVWSGLVAIVRSRYLLMISLTLLLSQFSGTMAYMQQTQLTGELFETPADRLAYFSRINFAGQTLTVLLQGAVAAWVMRRLGLSIALCALPVVYLISFAALGAADQLIDGNTVIWVLATAVVTIRGVSLGINVPAQQTLFTVVPREQKYKAKAFIDTVVFRGSDVIASATFTFLQARTAFSNIAVGLMVLTTLWVFVGWWLGKKQQQLAAQETEASPATD